MRVPTYSKFGLTKTQVEHRDIRDKKISDVLTHHLTIITGSVFGIVVYVINYTKIEPSNIFQMLVQIFLFASIGVLCVGIPAVLFKFAEILYLKFIRERSHELKDIQRYKEQRAIFDFWEIREDYSFWSILDGLSFQKEAINIFLYDGYEAKKSLENVSSSRDVLIEKNKDKVYIAFNTKPTSINSTERVDEVIKLKNKLSADKVMIISQKGFSRKALEYAKEKRC